METMSNAQTEFRLKDFLDQKMGAVEVSTEAAKVPTVTIAPEDTVLEHVRLDAEDYSERLSDRFASAWSLFFADKAWYISGGKETICKMFPSFLVVDASQLSAEPFRVSTTFQANSEDSSFDLVNLKMREKYLILPIAGFNHKVGRLCPTLKFHGFNFNMRSTYNRSVSIDNRNISLVDMIVFGQQVAIAGTSMSKLAEGSDTFLSTPFHIPRRLTQDRELENTPAKVLLETRELLEQNLEMFVSQLTGAI